MTYGKWKVALLKVKSIIRAIRSVSRRNIRLYSVSVAVGDVYVKPLPGVG